MNKYAEQIKQINEMFADFKNNDHSQREEEIMDLVLTKTIEAFSHNLPDILEIIIQVTFRELAEHTSCSKEVMQAFRDQAHELIDLN